MVLISVVVPTLNEEKTIEDTLKSLIGQIYRNFEVIIVDSGSKDKTLEILKKYQRISKKIKLRKIKEKNIAKVRNIGVRCAKGSIIAFLDCGRIAPRDWLRKVKKSFNDKNIAGSGGTFRILRKSRYSLFELFTALDKIYRGGFKKQTVNIVCTGNAAFKKEIIDEVGGFDETFAKRGENSDFCYRVSEKYKILYDPSTYVYYKDSMNLKKFLREHFLNGFYHFLLYKKHPAMSLGDSYRKFHFIMQALSLFFVFLLFLIYFENIYSMLFSLIFLTILFFILNLDFLVFVFNRVGLKATLSFLPLIIIRPFVWTIGMFHNILGKTIHNKC